MAFGDHKLHQLRSSSWKKRGLAVIPNKYCLAFGVKLLNQGAALLHVYTDGSVLLTHGGMEMGQGLHTKMVQVYCTKCIYTCMFLSCILSYMYMYIHVLFCHFFENNCLG